MICADKNFINLLKSAISAGKRKNIIFKDEI